MNTASKKTHLEVLWQTFIGWAKQHGATEEELEILVKAMGLIRKYHPFTKKEP